MHKYDFGYELEENSSNKWAYDKIKKESKILEIGASNGRLTKHLKEELNCSIDIIEINAEAGAIAEKFARKAYLGLEEGNIESPECIQSLGEETYDYIVLLDVLEHLLKPEIVLQKLKSHLNNDGSILISIPNIAHNSIIINLMKNKFEYTELGILDNTHLHFYTNSSFEELVENLGFYIVDNAAVQKLVGDTEIKNSYTEIPREVAAYLRTREQADVYQTLFELKTKGIAKSNCRTENLNYTLYTAQVYDGEGKNNLENFFVNPKDICFSVKINTTLDNNQIRIDPLDQNCVIRNIKITGLNKSGDIVELHKTNMNGFELQSGDIIFVSNDPQIIVSCMPDIEEVFFSCKCIAYDMDVLTYFEDIIKETLSLRAELADEKSKNKEFDINYHELLDAYQTTESVKDSIEEQYRNLEAQYRNLEKLYRDIKKEPFDSNL